MENNQYTPPLQYTPNPWLRIFRILMGIIAVILFIAMAGIGIGWLASFMTILVSGTFFGYDVFFGLPPIVIATLITAALYLAYWPVALVARGFWSLAKGVNKYEHNNIVTGGILFALSIAAIIIISLQFAKDINLDYKDENVRIIIDDGTVCVSETNLCDKK